jgi:NhaP-type Na+/H+ or K+/H+ antiporter
MADNLGGSGVLAVATLGIIFGNVRIKHKDELTDFSFGLSSILEILVFILIGVLVGNTLQLNAGLFLNAFLIFLALLVARFLAAQIALRGEYDFADRLVVSLMMPKGIAAAVLLFLFSSPLYPYIPESLSTTLFLVMFYSIILATATSYWWSEKKS